MDPSAPLVADMYPSTSQIANVEKAMTPSKPLDDVDFTSGYETQYKKEYRPVRQMEVPPPDPKTLWYRDWRTIVMILLLLAVLVFGMVVLVRLVFTTNPWKVLAITASYLMIAMVVIFIEVKSIHVR